MLLVKAIHMLHFQIPSTEEAMKKVYIKERKMLSFSLIVHPLLGCFCNILFLFFQRDKVTEPSSLFNPQGSAGFE